MSQSDEHRDLVISVAQCLTLHYSQISITTDVQQQPGDVVPPIIDGFRPDVYATAQNNFPITVIAEAKTAGDLNNQHTDAQSSAFVDYLERKNNGVFILAVTGNCADHAKTLMRFRHQIHRVQNTTVMVFDSHDLWRLDKKSGLLWHLI